MAHDRDHQGTDRLLDDPAFARTAAESIQALSAPSRLRSSPACTPGRRR